MNIPNILGIFNVSLDFFSLSSWQLVELTACPPLYHIMELLGLWKHQLLFLRMREIQYIRKVFYVTRRREYWCVVSTVLLYNFAMIEGFKGTHEGLVKGERDCKRPLTTTPSPVMCRPFHPLVTPVQNYLDTKNPQRPLRAVLSGSSIIFHLRKIDHVFRIPSSRGQSHCSGAGPFYLCRSCRLLLLGEDRRIRRCKVVRWKERIWVFGPWWWIPRSVCALQLHSL